MKKILYLFLFTATITVAQQPKFQKIDSLLTFLNTNNKFMGSLAIHENGKMVFSKAYGFADVETNKKLDENTKLKIGSITKTYTATMIMQLIDEKKLTLDTKLSKFYPKIPNADKITIHLLLHHRTGILDYINGDSLVVNNMYRYNTREEMLDRIASYKPVFEPNLKFEYSNSNYNLLGYILEDLTKKNYAENLNSRIIKKLGLKNTSFPEKIDVSKNEGYSFSFNGKIWEKVPEWSNSLAFAAGAISSTPNDLNTFLNGLFEGKLVSETSLEQMKTMEDNYGMGLIIAPFDGKKFYGHTGGIENFRAASGYLPEEKLGFSIVVNGDNFNRNDIMIGVLSLFYNKPYTFPDLKGFAVNSETLRKYVGTYSSKAIPIKINVNEVDGSLSAQATGQSAFPLTAKSNTEFVFAAGGIKLVFGDNKFTLKQGGIDYEFIKD